MGVQGKALDFSLKTHYQVLNLPQNCSFKDVRESFVKLSKEYHPDRNLGDTESHKSFVRIHEAYTVLSKPHSRQLYDASLMRRNYGAYSGLETNAPPGRVHVWRDESIYSMRDRSQDANYKNFENNYYGIKGIRKVSNSTIVLGCIFFMVVGIGMHYGVYRTTLTKSINNLKKKDQENLDWYNEVRRKALHGSKEENIERMRQKIENETKSSNP